MSNKKQLLLLLFLGAGLAAVFSYFFLWQQKGKELSCKDCNLIMISLSNVSAEHMSLYGYERVTTPYLDDWAKDAVVFENAFTQSSWTLPAATSLFTSLYPYSHKIMDRFVDNLLDEDIQTLPEMLRDKGYKTAAFVGGLDYNNSFGHMRGFDKFYESIRADQANNLAALTFSGFSSTFAKAYEWLEKNSDEKFFLFLHGYDTHCPFDPPLETKGTFSSVEEKDITVDHKLCLRGFEDSQNETYEAYYYDPKGVTKVILSKDDIGYLEDLYDEEILALDKFVGTSLDELDRVVPEDTLIIVFSDHGEMFAKHGRFGRAGGIRGTLYDEVVHIPLIMKIPEQKGKRVGGLVQMIDVMPTVLHILGVAQPGGLQGQNALPLIAGRKKEINDYVFTGSEFGGQEGRLLWPVYQTQSISESVRNKERKLIYEAEINENRERVNEKYELYNLRNDPEELQNLAEEEPLEALRLKEVLSAWVEEVKSYGSKPSSSPQLLPPEVIESSKQHGYF